MNKNLFQGELNFDSSLSEILDKTLNIEEYKERIISLLIPILKQRFPDDIEKQRIKIHRDRINFSCPYCGDSMQSSHKKRGNIILTGKYKNFYKCHNCDVFTKVNSFFKDFKIDLELDVINYISDNLGDFSTTSTERCDISLLMDIENIEKYAIDRSELKNSFNLIEVKQSSIWPWLTKRLQYATDKFLYNPFQNYILILNLTPSGKIIGSQKRLFKGYNKYLTFSASKLHELMGKEKVPDEIDLISQIFGIFQLNFNLLITMFEGPFDSFLFKNSISNAGANKSFPIIMPIRYWYDDDPTGRNKSIEKINEGNSVFLWGRFRKDMELPYRKKWDLNDTLVYFKENNIITPLFENYFSNDPLDIIDI